MADSEEGNYFIEDEDGDESTVDYVNRRRQKETSAQDRLKALIKRTIGKGKAVDSTVIVPRYYSELMIWAAYRHMEVEGWKVNRTAGYHEPSPDYMDINISCSEKQNLIRNGTLVIERNEVSLAVTIDADFENNGVLLVTASASNKTAVEEFTAGVNKIIKEQNFYRGKKVLFHARVHFLEVSGKKWDDVILDESTKRSIWANTIGFLNNRDKLKEYGVPCKRGVLLVGEPGTGKTLACKALLAKAEGITCVLASVDVMDNPRYLQELFEFARDLSPSIVFIEDIDLIAQEREVFGYSRGSALLTLLSVLDGVEEKDGIVTIASTNCKDTLDKAISKRPSRFDRIIYFLKPALKQRTELITLLCKTVPMDARTREYLSGRTENFTPAQIQEVVYGLAMAYCEKNEGSKPECLIFSKQEVDNAIGNIDRDNKQQGIGFTLNGNHKGGDGADKVSISN